MGWLPWRRGRRRSPFNNLGPQGLTCAQITEQLYIGGELGPRDWQALTAAGVNVLINLQQEQQDIFTRDEKLDGYLWLPAPDGLAPTLEQLRLGVSLIRASVSAGRKVFIHCKAGQGRAPLLAACYLLSIGQAPLAAMSVIRKARPRTMLTPEQNKRLREFAALLGMEGAEDVLEGGADPDLTIGSVPAAEPATPRGKTETPIKQPAV